MKNQALFSLKDKSKKLKYCLLQFLFGALRVNIRSPFGFRSFSSLLRQTRFAKLRKIQIEQPNFTNTLYVI